MPTNTKIFAANPDGSLPIASINEHMYELLNEYSIEEYPARHREHLGVSIIGDKCSRKLFYTFRWCKLTQAEPRMRRLWARGHSEEEKFRVILQYMGFFVREIDPLTNRQYKFSKINGHYGGSSDSLALMPWFRDEANRILVEFKTHNNKSFNKLKGDWDAGKRPAFKVSKPLHYDQMSCYGREFSTRYGLYCAVNKDNDEIFFELVELDWGRAIELENKADSIIQARLPLPKFSENPSTFECQYCDFQDICHNGEVVDENCRSCKFSSPVEKGEWKCNRWNTIIPGDKINQKYECHVSINE